ncbi:ATP synthase F1, delta subunit, putative [Cryptosporidium muris RN66]|uniref:ATP synthase F1, delta subunit, putative n=1 Tax=Cryptosporidium muris (strain RN66) TaxID=441375 RepID=B6AAU2_CRYMR|nr:ATP synthase F1, delta subunit, putative [Cryptosporidium muris RN66]EEA05494.1 ATP synthase F1, delta subunit, putative [Cryptosporidium muris RN66]|eukprot:XP_002139843.1 ATP synthase F1, delta subunit [Cryptosporidium muris RN66]
MFYCRNLVSGSLKYRLRYLLNQDININQSGELFIEDKYAHALFKIGKKGNELEILCEDLKFASDFIDGNKKLKQIFVTPGIPLTTKMELYNDLIQNMDLKSNTSKRFLQIIAQNQKIQHINKIYKSFMNAIERLNMINLCIVSSCKDLNDNQKQKLESLLKSLSNNIKIEYKVDPRLLGGIMIQVGELMLDLSALSIIEQIKNFITYN